MCFIMCRKESDSIEQEREIIFVFPDDDNSYGLGTTWMPLTPEEREELATWRVISFLNLYHWHLFFDISLWIACTSLLGTNCISKHFFQRGCSLFSFVPSFTFPKMLFQSLLFVLPVQVGVVADDEWQVVRMWTKWTQRRKHGSMCIQHRGCPSTDEKVTVSLEMWRIDLWNRNETALMEMASL